jgi:hypothetical protein
MKRALIMTVIGLNKFDAFLSSLLEREVGEKSDLEKQIGFNSFLFPCIKE